MGLFTDFLSRGFKSGDRGKYEPGTLFEIKAKLGDNDSAEKKTGRVKALLQGWVGAAGEQPPTYALEIHATNEPENPLHGYGTFAFVADPQRESAMTQIRTTWSEPLTLQDDEDPLKVISGTYANEAGFPTRPELTVYELGLAASNYYPIRVWEKGGDDPMWLLFSIFEIMAPHEFAGVSIVLTRAENSWKQPAYNHIRDMEDPEYAESLSMGRRIMNMINGVETKTGDTTITGYKRQELTPEQRAEKEEILRKLKDDTAAFWCTIRVYASTPDLARRIADILTQSTSTTTQGQGLVVATERGNLLEAAQRRQGRHAFVLKSEEIATLWHVPDEALYGERGHGGRLCHRPEPAATRPPDDLIFVRTGGPADLQALIAKLSSGGV